jgi:hypothetical protein
MKMMRGREEEGKQESINKRGRERERERVCERVCDRRSLKERREKEKKFV